MPDDEEEQPVPEVIITFNPEELSEALSEGRENIEKETEDESG